MNRRRATIQVEIDLDPIAGWGDNAEDMRQHVENLLERTVPHYNPRVTLVGVDIPEEVVWV